jgi:hypothetical protein
MKISDTAKAALNSGMNMMSSLATHPKNAKAGDTYLNTTDNHLYTYDGSQWVQISSGAEEDHSIHCQEFKDLLLVKLLLERNPELGNDEKAFEYVDNLLKLNDIEAVVYEELFDIGNYTEEIRESDTDLRFNSKRG